jgi:polysaccharide biosynthesis protein PelD
MDKITLSAYAEAITFSVLVLGLCFYLRPEDPLMITSNFPWIWFLPALIALRHGRLPGLVAAAGVLVVMAYNIRTTEHDWNSYRLWVLGGVTLTLICGEYYEYWLRRQFSLGKKEQYLDTRLESISRAYGVMRISHDRLEEAIIVKPATLREALTEIRHLLAKNHGELNHAIAEHYMGILSYQAELEDAGLYLLDENGKWNLEPVATTGKAERLILDDVLIENCLNKKITTYFAVNFLEENEASRYLVAVPMLTAADELIGLLVVSKMPFLALNDETLKKLSLMLAYIADEIWATKNAQSIQAQYPDCPTFFASELLKLFHLYRIAKVNSCVVAYYFSEGPQVDEIRLALRQNIRGLDIVWEAKHYQKDTLLILMPLTEPTMFMGYIGRIEKLLEQQFQIKIGGELLKMQYRQLSDYTGAKSLLEDLLSHDPL